MQTAIRAEKRHEFKQSIIEEKFLNTYGFIPSYSMKGTWTFTNADRSDSFTYTGNYTMAVTQAKLKMKHTRFIFLSITSNGFKMPRKMRAIKWTQ